MTIAVLTTCVLAVGFAAADVVITVDNSTPRQVMEGFGATTFSLVHSGPLGDTLTPDLRRRAVEACYGQVNLNLGNLEIGFVRRRLRDLAAKHGLATWMTEVSHGEAPALGFDLLRGRAHPQPPRAARRSNI